MKKVELIELMLTEDEKEKARGRKRPRKMLLQSPLTKQKAGVRTGELTGKTGLREQIAAPRGRRRLHIKQSIRKAGPRSQEGMRTSFRRS